MIRIFCLFLTIGFVLLSYSSDTPQSYKIGIVDIVKKNKKQINKCASDVGKASKKPKGKITLLWEVDELGKAHSFSKSQDTIENQELYHCLEKTITSWKFPKPPFERAIDVEHEFTF